MNLSDPTSHRDCIQLVSAEPSSQAVRDLAEAHVRALREFGVTGLTHALPIAADLVQPGNFPMLFAVQPQVPFLAKRLAITHGFLIERLTFGNDIQVTVDSGVATPSEFWNYIDLGGGQVGLSPYPSFVRTRDYRSILFPGIQVQLLVKNPGPKPAPITAILLGRCPTELL